MESAISSRFQRCVWFRWGGREEELVKTLRLSEIEPGMILARDIKGRFGRGLLQAGNTITAKHIKIFKSWGITEINIENSDSRHENSARAPPPTPPTPPTKKQGGRYLNYEKSQFSITYSFLYYDRRSCPYSNSSTLIEKKGMLSF